MVIRNVIDDELGLDFGGMCRKIGRIDAFRYRAVELITICMDIYSHIDNEMSQKAHQDLTNIKLLADEALDAAAGHTVLQPTEETDDKFQHCMGRVRRFGLVHLTPCRVSGAKEKLTYIMIHNSLDQIPEGRPHKLYDDTTISELVYRLNKGISDVRIPLAGNPRFYRLEPNPGAYLDAKSLGFRQPTGQKDVIPRKEPEVGLSVFFDMACPIIHVLFDNYNPVCIILKTPFPPCPLTLTKWHDQNAPWGVFRGKVVHFAFRASRKLIRDITDPGGVLYDGRDLGKTLTGVDQEGLSSDSMFNTWVTLRSEQSDEPIPPDLLQSSTSFDEWLKASLKNLNEFVGTTSRKKSPPVQKPTLRRPKGNPPTIAAIAATVVTVTAAPTMPGSFYGVLPEPDEQDEQPSTQQKVEPDSTPSNTKSKRSWIPNPFKGIASWGKRA
ncbi:hypothetical protein FRC12_010979 [Ceratobasidium sp. 428]|nr:hypothetical protein FRC12_010979 [Ceratobasidium sp. 428]